MLHMTHERESDLIAYILAGFIIAISGIAVGVASTHTSDRNSESIDNKAAVTAPAPVSAAKTQTLQKD
jgi:hypothetical protein